MKKKQLILVADDDKEVLKMLSRLFELEGYEVITADDGRAVVSRLGENSPDLIILDIMMPGLNGFQVLDIVRRNSDVPVIMLTARGEVTTLHNALNLGADDYIKKPFHTRELLARVRTKLRRTRPGLNHSASLARVSPDAVLQHE